MIAKRSKVDIVQDGLIMHMATNHLAYLLSTGATCQQRLCQLKIQRLAGVLAVTHVPQNQLPRAVQNHGLVMVNVRYSANLWWDNY
jgi:hypothetical protein